MFEISDEAIELGDENEIDLHSLADAGVGESFDEPDAMRRAIELGRDRGRAVRMVGVLEPARRPEARWPKRQDPEIGV